jgi:hypothetical protein
MSEFEPIQEEPESTYISFAEEVWDTLSRIDCAEFTGTLEKTAKRPEIDYLPWHSAWMLLKRKFPASTFLYEDDLRHPDGTVEVGCVVKIAYCGLPGSFSVPTYARLAVMDNWMNPIANPTARQVNDSRQRVLVKALAFAGLGLNLWSKDSFPVGTLEDPISDDQVEMINDLIEKSGTITKTFLKWCGADEVKSIQLEKYNSAISLLEAKIRRKNKGGAR